MLSWQPTQFQRVLEEELARDWTLSPVDKLVVLPCRGETHRLKQFGSQKSLYLVQILLTIPRIIL
jgi:hypothetical protein